MPALLPTEQTLSPRPSLIERMRDPKDELRPLIARGEQLQREVAQITADAKIANPKVSAGIGLADIVFGFRGYKGFATAAGKYLAWSSLIGRSRALSSSFEQWWNETISKLRTNLRRSKKPDATREQHFIGCPSNEGADVSAAGY